MNTKNILKTLALAMLLVSACNKSEIANDENAEKKGFALPVTVNVTREGDDATKATYTDNGDGTGSLGFSTGDKLFVKGNHEAAGLFAGALDYDAGSGNFSGTIYTKNLYDGTAAALFTSATLVRGTLLPNGYGSTGFLSINNNSTPDDATDDYVSTNYAKAIALTKNAAVEQLSWEQGNYSGSFILQPRSAILNFTITGLAASTQVAVVFTSNNGTVNENVTTDALGNATFALGVSGGEGLHNCTLSVAGNPVTLVTENKTLTAGKIYNINRSAASSAATGHALSSAVVGDIICSDGLAYNGSDYDNLPTGVTAKAKVCYVSGGHGLALALADEGQMNWSTAISTCAAKTPTVTGCTWKLASEAEWNNMIDAAGSRDALRDGFSGVGGSDLQSNMSSKYWSSTEKDAENAWSIGFNSWGGWGSATKTISIFYARACLTF